MKAPSVVNNTPVLPLKISEVVTSSMPFLVVVRRVSLGILYPISIVIVAFQAILIVISTGIYRT